MTNDKGYWLLVAGCWFDKATIDVRVRMKTVV